MGLFRLLILIALIATAYWLWRRLTRPAPPAENNKDEPKPMVRCAQCGTHVPQDRAIHADQRWYCSTAHLEQDRRDRAD